MWTRSELKSNAKIHLKANYWKAVLVGFILTCVVGSGASSASQSAQKSDADVSNFSSQMILVILSAVLLGTVIHLVVSIFLWNPLEVGCQKFFVNCKYGTADLKNTYSVFKDGYGSTVKTMLFRSVYTLLWTLLFIIPGIVKSYEYMMIPFLIAENPEMSKEEAFARSKEMMNGNKWNTFVLDLSFIGWQILSVFTCGLLAIFYVEPYVYMTHAELYHTLKNQ